VKIMIVPTPAKLAARIAFRMKELELSNSKAAAACNLSQASFETYLYGQHLPGALALASMSHGLRCSADWLLFGETRA
jgi:hypothetical protein